MILLYFALAILIFWYFFVTKSPPNFPPAPFFRVPGLGHALYTGFGAAQIQGFKKLRKKFGDMFYVENGPFKMIIVNDLKTIEEMSSMEVFSGRIDFDYETGRKINARIKGGHGRHGLIGNYGEEWKEQRRFALRHLRDFGFGKSSMEDIILEELNFLIIYLKDKIQSEGSAIETHNLFNTCVLNVLWRIVTGRRFDPESPEQQQKIEDLANMFSKFGAGQLMLFVILLLWPKALDAYQPGFTKFENVFKHLFDMFEDEYRSHEETYDENSLRDYTDTYIQERKRVEAEGEINSSFYGEFGRLNFKNSYFDLFLAGSETTSTSLTFSVLYMVSYPEIQNRLYEEIDRVVGRNRLPRFGDQKSLPYLEAFISEVQRHATIAPFAVQHTALDDVNFKGYRFPKHTIFTFNLEAVMHSEEHFPDPMTFNPDRFLDENGKYKPNKALIYFGLGKRECLGRSLAKQELYLFTAGLIQQFRFEMGESSGKPDLINCNVGITRSPKKCKVDIVSRNE